jgi:hypothetical protein
MEKKSKSKQKAKRRHHKTFLRLLVYKKPLLSSQDTAMKDGFLDGFLGPVCPVVISFP